jgi:hypothetical protein
MESKQHLATACIYKLHNPLTASPALKTETRGHQFFCMPSKIQSVLYQRITLLRAGGNIGRKRCRPLYG